MRFTTTIFATLLGADAALAAALPHRVRTTLAKLAKRDHWHPAGDKINTVTLDDQDPGSITAKFHIGSHDYPINMLLNAQSPDLWLWTTDYRDPPPHKEDQHRKPEHGHNLYKPDSSASVLRVPEKDGWFDYGADRGAVGYKAYKDTFKFGDYGVQGQPLPHYMAVDNLTFGGVYTFEGDMDTAPSDGRLGLGLDSEFVAKSVDDWNKPLFAVEIMPIVHNEYDMHSYITFGDFGTSGLETDIKYSPLVPVNNHPSSWIVGVQKVDIVKATRKSNQGHPIHDNHTFPLIVDFTTPMTSLPKRLVERFVMYAKGTMHDWVRPLIPCDLPADEIPDITITLAGGEGGPSPTVVIKGQHLLAGPMGGQPGLCDVHLAPVGEGDSVGTLGFHAIKGTYLVHDFGQKRMGFAAVRPSV